MAAHSLNDGMTIDTGCKSRTQTNGETGLIDFVDVDVGHCWGAPSYVPSSYYGEGAFREVGRAARVDLGEHLVQHVVKQRPAAHAEQRFADPADLRRLRPSSDRRRG